jgi:nucleoside-diphosphate-sugar epimerase
MGSRLFLVTGGTGLLGSHIAEQLVRRGDRVRALVRPTSDTRFLKSLGVELVGGDLTDPIACERALAGADVVFHSAAKVGDWGNWSDFKGAVIDATQNLAHTARREGVERFVQISSTSAYGHPREGGPPVDETAPLGVGIWPIWDQYTRSKVEAERLLWRLREEGLPLTVIRPSWLFGERDRTTTARLVAKLREAAVPLIGPGDNPLSAIDASEAAEAALMAADDPGSVGEAYNVTDQGPITQREFLGLLADACGAPPPLKSMNYDMAFAVALGLEIVGRLSRSRTPPVLTRYATWLMGRHLSYSTAKARDKLGWTPRLDYRASLERTVRWHDLNRERGRIAATRELPGQDSASCKVNQEKEKGTHQDPHSHALPTFAAESLSDLSEVERAWSSLPSKVRAKIMAIVRSATKEADR